MTDGAQFQLEEAVAVLSRTPATLAALLRDQPSAWIDANEGPETWSPFDVLGHLVHGERTDWLARSRMVLEHGQSKAFDPFDRFAMFEESRGKGVGDLLEEFAELRSRNLGELEKLGIGPDELNCVGRHPDFGAVTLRQLLAAWVVHDLGHLAQISRTMAKRYRDEVGPWRVYLPVLDAGRASE